MRTFTFRTFFLYISKGIVLFCGYWVSWLNFQFSTDEIRCSASLMFLPMQCSHKPHDLLRVWKRARFTSVFTEKKITRQYLWPISQGP